MKELKFLNSRGKYNRPIFCVLFSIFLSSWGVIVLSTSQMAVVEKLKNLKKRHLHVSHNIYIIL